MGRPALLLLLGVRLLGCAGGAVADTPVAPAPSPSAAPSADPDDAALFAFGDVHGDFEAARRALRLAGAIDESDRWSGGRRTVVQVGDQLDRGDGERRILDLFERLRTEARAAGGAFVVLLGNHETMNVRGDFRYVTRGGWAEFADVPHDPADPAFADIPEDYQGRVAAFRPGGPYATSLAGHPVIHVQRGTVFVHGGLLPAHVAYGVDRINSEVSAWMRGDAGTPPILNQKDNPLWARHYSQAPDAADCALLRQALDAVGAVRMVVAHTVQDRINSACGGAVWRVDVGMSAHYGGQAQVLRVGDDVTVVGP
jgi:hypothetical protein